jgi:5'-3' exonuclease
MARYIIVDLANMFYRCRHAVQGDPYSKAGLALHAVFRSIKKMWREHKGDHVVFCLEGRSWRFGPHPKYKANRRVDDLLITNREREENQVFSETFTELQEFLINKTNATVLQSDGVEGDDFIARWTQMHPDDEHIIVSGDTDFIQLLADNIKIYDGVRELLIGKDAVLDKDGVPLEFSVKSDGKLKVGKAAKADFVVEPLWWRRALFMKCMRGDSGDNIFSAYPKVREKKLIEAWDDRIERGFNWNNLMLQTWTEYDENDEPQEVKVYDKFMFNTSLIDLTKQPEDVKDLMDATIVERVQKKHTPAIGIHFMRFCEKNGLINIGKEAEQHAVYLNAQYAK